MTKGWADIASCPRSAYRLFFTADVISSEVEAKLKNICAQCPVLSECSSYAMEQVKLHGFWAGKMYSPKADTTDPDIPALCFSRLIIGGPSHLSEMTEMARLVSHVGVTVALPGRLPLAPHAVVLLLVRSSELGAARTMADSLSDFSVAVVDSEDSREARHLFGSHYVSGDLATVADHIILEASAVAI